MRFPRRCSPARELRLPMGEHDARANGGTTCNSLLSSATAACGARAQVTPLSAEDLILDSHAVRPPSMRTFLQTLSRRSALTARASALLAVAACLGCSSGSDDAGDGGGQVAIAPLSREPTSKGVTFDSAQLSLALVSLKACAADTATLHTQNFSIELLHQPAPRVIF